MNSGAPLTIPVVVVVVVVVMAMVTVVEELTKNQYCTCEGKYYHIHINCAYMNSDRKRKKP